MTEIGFSCLDILDELYKTGPVLDEQAALSLVAIGSYNGQAMGCAYAAITAA